MEYFAVQESSADALTDTVNEMLEDGWKLQGGMSVGGDNGYRFFCQAMVKDAKI